MLQAENDTYFEKIVEFCRKKLNNVDKYIFYRNIKIRHINKTPLIHIKIGILPNPSLFIIELFIRNIYSIQHLLTD